MQNSIKKNKLQIDRNPYSSLSAPFLFGSSTNASVSCSSDIPCKYGFNGGGLQNDPFLNIRKSSVLHLVGASPYKRQEFFWFVFISLSSKLQIDNKKKKSTCLKNRVKLPSIIHMGWSLVFK